MRILLDQAEHTLRNKGNNALLEAAMGRLRIFWPDASFDLVTIAPNLAKMYYPDVQPVSPFDLHQYQSRFDPIQKLVPSSVKWSIFELREEMWHRRSSSAQAEAANLEKKLVSDGDNLPSQVEVSDVLDENEVADDFRERQALREAISVYDLYVATGGGYMCDHDASLPGLFDRLEAAIAGGVPTVMVGQGVGPMVDRELLERAREILPHLDLICYRNQRLGRPLLDSLGVPPERMVMTGDDAIELAYNARPASLGTGIGVSLRLSAYTQIGRQHIDNIRTIVHRAATERKAQLVAVPISSAHHESDVTHIKQLLAGYDDVAGSWRKLDTPLEAIKKAGRCRLMITGTYHGAIFSLAQGIPVIGLAKSVEYFNKLAELTDEFGPGCQVLRLDEQQIIDYLTTAIDKAWSSAEEFRPELLGAAARQIECQHSAYQRIYDLVMARKNATGIPLQTRSH